MTANGPSKSSSTSSINWGREVMASVVVFLVALPLCMGIAIASGAPPALGLVTGIIGGIVVGSIAGAPLQVSGPAAGLTVLVWQLIETHGIAALGVAVLLAGALQAIAGACKLGRWFRAVSPALISGMLAGIGVIIFASQFHVMIDDAPRSGAVQNLLSIPGALLKSLTPGSDHQLAALVGLVTVVVIVSWNKLRPDRLKSVPGPLIGISVGTAMAHLMGWSVKLVDVPASLAASLNIPPLDIANLLLDPVFVSEAVGIGLIASAETLLCATAVDRMAKDVRTDYDRELLAQGIGNVCCGVVGALPMTGVIVRSTANVEAGAKTRVSAILHGIWLLGLVALLPFVLNMIPTAALAGILVFIGYRLVDPAQIKKWWNQGRGEALVFLTTVIAIVATDLLTGVLVGLGVALIKLLNTFAKLEIELDGNGDDDRIDVGMHGAATFMKLPILAGVLENLPQGREVHLHVGGLSHVDHACMELFRDFQSKYRDNGGEVVVSWDELRLRHHEAMTPIGPRPSEMRVVGG